MRSRHKLHWQAASVLLSGLLITAGLTVASALNYAHNEQRLTSLQTRLTASILQTVQPQLQATLGRIVGLSAATGSATAMFRAAMAGELVPHGPFSSATLAVVQDGQVRVLDHVGSAPIQALDSAATRRLLLRAAHSSSLVTSRVVRGPVQKLGYLLSARGPHGVFVVGASQELPAARRAAVPARSPDANLNFALYFGRSATPAALVETNMARLPLTGTVSRASVPFGNNVLTLVASPRTSLAGPWAEFLPWGILALGILLSVAAAVVAEKLVRRRRTAESMYTEQRRLSEALQRSLLPRRMPTVAGWEFAARYVPATQGAEIGGDWYSVVEVDDHRFALVVGDVSGHDMAAAGVMAALRYTIRTLAKLGIAPDEILMRTATELDVVTDDHFATVLVGLVNTRRQEVVLASAGHPPPLLVHDGRAEFLRVAPGVPLGVPGAGRPEPATAPFPPAATLVAFTDGLVEQRGQSLDARMEALAAAAAGSSPHPHDLIDSLLAALTGDDQEDDVAVLAIRLLAHEAAAGPAASPRTGSTSVPEGAPPRQDFERRPS